MVSIRTVYGSEGRRVLLVNNSTLNITQGRHTYTFLTFDDKDYGTSKVSKSELKLLELTPLSRMDISLLSPGQSTFNTTPTHPDHSNSIR